MHEDRIADGIVDATFQVHRFFGPGLLESAYEACLAHELLRMGFKVERQVALPLAYLKLTGDRLGLIINFHSALLKNGMRRVVNNLQQ